MSLDEFSPSWADTIGQLSELDQESPVPGAYDSQLEKRLERLAWRRMHSRCSNPADDSWEHYGARGIYVCEAWFSFPRFQRDVGRRPSKHHSLDRIDNDGPYCPSNCRWATHLQQISNRRTTITVFAFGEVKTLADWARARGVRWEALYYRIMEANWAPERALTEPLKGAA